MIKKCSNCEKEFEIFIYYRNVKFCKECKSISRAKQRKIWLSLHPWVKTLCSIRQRCCDSKHISFKFYGGIEIKNLLNARQLEFLWFRDKAFSMKHPQIHRKDNNGNYTLENCSYVERFQHLQLHKKKNA